MDSGRTSSPGMSRYRKSDFDARIIETRLLLRRWTPEHVAISELFISPAPAVATLVGSYFAFRWLLICIHEWQIGQKNPFTIWADMRAIPLAFLAAAMVFCVVLSAMKRSTQNRT
jgi:hypothetical protein